MRISFRLFFLSFFVVSVLFTSNRTENTITFEHTQKNINKLHTEREKKKKQQQSHEIQYGVGCYDVFRLFASSTIRPFHLCALIESLRAIDFAM